MGLEKLEGRCHLSVKPQGGHLGCTPVCVYHPPSQVRKVKVVERGEGKTLRVPQKEKALELEHDDDQAESSTPLMKEEVIPACSFQCISRRRQSSLNVSPWPWLQGTRRLLPCKGRPDRRQRCRRALDRRKTDFCSATARAVLRWIWPFSYILPSVVPLDPLKRRENHQPKWSIPCLRIVSVS